MWGKKKQEEIKNTPRETDDNDHLVILEWLNKNGYQELNGKSINNCNNLAHEICVAIYEKDYYKSFIVAQPGKYSLRNFRTNAAGDLVYDLYEDGYPIKEFNGSNTSESINANYFHQRAARKKERERKASELAREIVEEIEEKERREEEEKKRRD